MNDIRYIPVEKNIAHQSFLYDVQFALQSNGLWIAWIAALPGCAAWGASQDDALAMLTQTTRAYLRMLRDKGVQVPDSVATVNAPVVAVTI
jgi:predicted RNase H-like HicB family nuclease